MKHFGKHISNYGLENHGITDAGDVYWNQIPAQLYEQILDRGEGILSADGPLIIHTGEYTGRSPLDKYIIRDETTENHVWWGDINQWATPAQFTALKKRMMAHIADTKQDLHITDAYAGADPEYRLPVRVISQYAWHGLFSNNMFIRETDKTKLETHVPEFTVITVPSFEADPAIDGIRSGTFIFVNFTDNIVLVGGSQYGGEIKKSVFSALNYYLPLKGVMSMHCSANYGETKEDTAVFFGLSGTGKTTLSSDPNRTLIGDDEHGWSDNGVFNYEGGCYAKAINISPTGEPEIFATTKKFGTIIENVEFDPDTRTIDYSGTKYTQNTRIVYPVTHLDNVDVGGMTSHAKNIIFLTADAFGVLPPISKLTREQAMYHFLSGYTAKVAGTERGVTEPVPAFSSCFGAPFLPLHPGVYADLLGQKIDKHDAKIWLINTGWNTGPAGDTDRIKLSYTRSMVTAALSGDLDDIACETEPFFGLAIPTAVKDVPTALLTPRNSWADKAAYDAQAAKLVGLFIENFKQFESGVSAEVIAAGPKAL